MLDFKIDHSQQSNREIYIHGGKVWSSQGVEDLGLWVVDGKICERVTDVHRAQELSQRAQVVSAEGKWVIPGVIDTQVHFREPGLEHKEDIATGSLSALLGGVTTFFEMPNTSPPTTTILAVEDKLSRAHQSSYVNYGFFIGATADNLQELQSAASLPGCCGIKIFLGSSTGDLLLYDPDCLRAIFLGTDQHISIHSEDETRLRNRRSIRDAATSVHAHNEWRDVACALQSTQMVLQLARECSRRVHILHVSTADEMQYLAQNKDIASVEVTPQHLSLASPDCYDVLGTRAQMNPPIRDLTHQEGLWRGVLDNTVDVMGSDHAPHTLEEKSQPYPQSPSGLTGVQTMLYVMLDHMQKGKISMKRVIELLCEKPAQMFGLNKGFLNPGYDADIVIIDPHTMTTITDQMMASRSGWTPFHGKSIECSISDVIVGGERMLYHHGQNLVLRSVKARHDWVLRKAANMPAVLA